MFKFSVYQSLFVNLYNFFFASFCDTNVNIGDEIDVLSNNFFKIFFCLEILIKIYIKVGNPKQISARQNDVTAKNIEVFE